MVGDQDRLTDRPVPAQRTGTVREDDGAAAGERCGADPVGDDGRVVALVEVDPSEEHEHAPAAEPHDPDRAPWPDADGGGKPANRRAARSARRRARPRRVPSRIRAPRRCRTGRCPCVTTGSGSLGREAIGLRGGGHGAGSYDPPDAHHRVARRPRRPDRPDQAPHHVAWLEVRDVDTMIDAIRRLAVAAPLPSASPAGSRSPSPRSRAAAPTTSGPRPTGSPRHGRRRSTCHWPSGACPPACPTAPTRSSPRLSSCARRTCARTGPSPPRRRAARGAARRPRPPAHALQRRRVGVRRVGHGAGHRAGDARAGQPACPSRPTRRGRSCRGRG